MDREKKYLSFSVKPSFMCHRFFVLFLGAVLFFVVVVVFLIVWNVCAQCVLD